MSPAEIQNPEAYHDRTVQDWHRRTFPRDYWAIDIDLMGGCKRCADPLYLIEASQNPDKPTRFIRRLAKPRETAVPALLVRHHDGVILGGHILGSKNLLSDEYAVEEYIHGLRRDHAIVHDNYDPWL